jgi:signal transduction histidine kinase
MMDVRQTWDRLPPVLRSIRFRLALIYSVVLFGLAALVVGGLYVGLRASLHEQPIAHRFAGRGLVPGPDGRPRPADIFLGDYRNFEREVNARTLDQLRRLSFGALGGLFVASLGVGWVISGRVLRPIDRITNVARDIQAADLSRRIHLEGPEDELKRLSDTFDGMLGRLEGAFNAQRQFVADASHELRNPLATLRTNLDLVPDAASPEEARTLLDAAQRAAERMGRLVDDLLVLAREGTPLSRREPIDLAEASRQVVEEFAGRASARGLQIDAAAAAPAMVTVDPDAVKRALANLVDNAVRLAPEGTTVRVGSGVRGAWAWTAVADEGPGMTDAERSHAFDRFWRADVARSRAGGGAGLGLAIVRQIAEAHGGTARTFAEGSGSVFVVWLRLAPDAGTAPSVSPMPLLKE